MLEEENFWNVVRKGKRGKISVFFDRLRWEVVVGVVGVVDVDEWSHGIEGRI